MAKGTHSTQSNPAALEDTAEDTAEDTVLSWPPDSSQNTPHYRIFVRDLVLTGLIGIHPHEQDQPQRVRFNIDLLVEDNCDATGDDIANVVSYEDIVSGIKNLFARGHVGLVETLAEDIANMCRCDGRVRAVRVRVEKLDVFDEAASVGVEIERRSRDST